MKRTDILTQNTVFTRIALATGMILLVPAVGMQFTHEIQWDMVDFIVMGTLLFGAGSLFVLVARQFSKKYRGIIGLIVFCAFLWLWAELAVGVFTNWGS